MVTTTGTGWVDPDAASSLEYLHGGDTALVGLQYSYLPSWISFLVDRDEAAEAGVALYRHVHRRWSAAPGRGPRQADHLRREPRLLRRRGGLPVAPTPRRRWPTSSPAPTARCSPAPPRPTRSGASSPTTGEPGSPGVAPRLRRRHQGPVRQPARRPGTPRPGLDGTRGSSTSTIPRTRSGTRPWRRSGAGRNGPSAPRGYDVPARAGWFPIVTGVQEVADLIAGFSAPSGYGHNYGDRLRERLGGRGPTGAAGRRPTAPGSSSTSPPSEPPRRGRSSGQRTRRSHRRCHGVSTARPVIPCLPPAAMMRRRWPDAVADGSVGTGRDTSATEIHRWPSRRSTCSSASTSAPRATPRGRAWTGARPTSSTPSGRSRAAAC